MGWLRDAHSPGFDAQVLMTGDEALQGIPLAREAAPSLGDTFGAAFGQENVIGSALVRRDINNTLVEPDFNPLDDDFIRGYEDYFDRFADMNNRGAAEALKAQIDDENERRRTIERAGWTGLAAEITAGTLDVTAFIPVAGQAKKGESLLRIGGRFAAGAGAGAIASETALQGTQETRTMEQSSLNVGGAVLLGGLLGSGGTAAYRGATGKPIYGFDPSEIDALGARIDSEMIYDPDGDPAFAADRADMQAMRDSMGGSVGAARVTPLDEDDFRLADSFNAGEINQAMGWNPLLRLTSATSVKARQIAARLMSNGMYLGRNVGKQGDFQPSPLSAEDNMNIWRGAHAEALTQYRKAFAEHKKTAATKMSRHDFATEVSKALRRGDVHPDPAVVNAARAWRQTMDKVSSDAVEVGILPKDLKVRTAPSYLHRMWNSETLKARTQDFLEMSRKYFGDTFENMKMRAANIEIEAERIGAKLSDEDADLLEKVRELQRIEADEGGLEQLVNDSADHVFAQLTGQTHFSPVAYDITSGPRGPLKERTFNIPDLFVTDVSTGRVAVEDFLENDIERVMQRYMRVATTDIEIAREFGDVTMKDVLEDIRRDYMAKIKALDPSDTKQSAALNKEMMRVLKDVEGVRNVMRGTYQTPTYDQKFSKGAMYVRQWNYVTQLGGMTVSALADVANKVLSYGVLGIGRDILAPAITNLRGVRMAGEEARNLGIVIERALSSRIAAMADIGDIYGKTTQFDRITESVTEAFTRTTLMREWNDIMKMSDYLAGSAKAVRTMRNYAKAGRHDKSWLNSLGIGKADHQRILAQIDRYGETVGGMTVTHADKWDDVQARRIWAASMGKNANIVTVTPGAGDKPLVMNGDIGKTIGQFKTFLMGANQRVFLRAAQAGRQGDAKVLAFVLTAISAGMLVYKIKSDLSGRETSDDPAVWVREGIDRSGVVSIFMDGFNTAEKVTGKTFVGDSPASRYASRGVFASLLGPSIGKGEDFANFIKNSMDGDLKDRDIHATRKLLPFNNVFWLRTLLDDMEIMIAEELDAEKTAFSDTRTKRIVK